jgi:hypothetical protein
MSRRTTCPLAPVPLLEPRGVRAQVSSDRFAAQLTSSGVEPCVGRWALTCTNTETMDTLFGIPPTGRPMDSDNGGHCRYR